MKLSFDTNVDDIGMSNDALGYNFSGEVSHIIISISIERPW